jgi:hypothetical protein
VLTHQRRLAVDRVRAAVHDQRHPSWHRLTGRVDGPDQETMRVIIGEDG